MNGSDVASETMTTAQPSRHRPTQDRPPVAEIRAVRFFWAVLILATGASIAGNVTHAVLHAAASTVTIAAAASLVPPSVLLGATHSVALLVKTHAGNGFAYCFALSMTLALAVCAFVLSFHALRGLAITAGIDPQLAWLWPLVVDLSIAQATMALLALTGRPRRPCQTGELPRSAGNEPAPTSRDAGPAAAKSIGRLHQASTASPNGRAHTQRAAVSAAAEGPAATERSADEMLSEPRWRKVADSLVRERRTRIDAETVIKVLALADAHIPPSTIARRLKLHHTSIRRIQKAAVELAGSDR